MCPQRSAPTTSSGTETRVGSGQRMVGLCPERAGRDRRASSGDPGGHTGALVACPARSLFSSRTGPSSPPGPPSGARSPGQVGQHRREGSSPGLSSVLRLGPPSRGSCLSQPLQCHPSDPFPVLGWASFTGGSRASGTAKSQCTEDRAFQRLPESTGLPGAAPWSPPHRLLAGALKSLEGESLHSGPPSHAVLKRPWGTWSPWDPPFSGDPRSCVLSTRLPPAKEQRPGRRKAICL